MKVRTTSTTTLESRSFAILSHLMLLSKNSQINTLKTVEIVLSMLSIINLLSGSHPTFHPPRHHLHCRRRLPLPNVGGLAFPWQVPPFFTLGLILLLILGLILVLNAVLIICLSAYFCFITLTTIGFGDLTPDQKMEDGEKRIALCSLYLLFGIAMIAMSFNLVQEEVIVIIAIVNIIIYKLTYVTLCRLSTVSSQLERCWESSKIRRRTKNTETFYPDYVHSCFKQYFSMFSWYHIVLRKYIVYFVKIVHFCWYSTITRKNGVVKKQRGTCQRWSVWSRAHVGRSSFLCCHQLLELFLAQLSVSVPVKLGKHRRNLLLAQLLWNLLS